MPLSSFQIRLRSNTIIWYTRRASSVAIILFALYGIRAQTVNHDRKPLASISDEELKYKPTGTRFRKHPATQQLIEYAVSGKIRHDQRTHTYLLEWMGYDGRIKKLNWIPPNKVNAVVAGVVHYNAGARLFEYSYEVVNLPNSLQKLQSFYVTSQKEVVGGSNPNETWYSSGFTPYLRKVFKTEDGWTWSQTIGGRLGLEPGESSKGFSFRSGGVPVLGKCYVRGYTETLHASEDVPEELMDAIDRAAWKVPYGYTIVPGLPPDKLSPQVIVENMSQALRIAAEQGWFAKTYDGNDLLRSIEEMRRAIDSESHNEVLHITEKAAHLADAASAHQLISSELHGLLTYNLMVLRREAGGAR